MRIISGQLKGRSFSVPKSFPSRPTTDFAKEGLFNVLNNIITIDQLAILDLCAGTGNLSFEFASRGAATLTCVDKNPKVISWIKKNSVILDIDKKINAITQDAVTFLNRTENQFDLIIADQPYDLPIHHSIVNLVFERRLLTLDGILIVEHGKQTNLTTETNYLNTRTFGNVNFSFFK